MKDLLNKLSNSEIRDRKKNFPKLHPLDIQKKNKEIFDNSYFGKEYINNLKTNKHGS